MGYFPTAKTIVRPVQFMYECWLDREYRDAIANLRAESISVIYLNCADYLDQCYRLRDAIGYAAGLDHPPYTGDQPIQWVRWWDDLYSLGVRSSGLVLVLDNSHLMFDAERPFMTFMLEWFVLAHRSWAQRNAPLSVCFQMAPCPALGAAFAVNDMQIK